MIMTAPAGTSALASASGLATRSAAFLSYLDEMMAALAPASLNDVVRAAGGPDRVALVAVDVINGFCVEGPLAGPRVAAIVPPIERLFRAAHEAGVRRYAVLRDSHSSNAPEFEQFGPHCHAGTNESALVAELAGLPFAGTFTDVPKNAISAWAGQSRFRDWVEAQNGVRAYIVVGDCTDLCLYQTAMVLKLQANARDEPLSVIVPVDCVETYDLPVETARGIGALPHDGDLLHAVFLYHLRLNGIQVVSRLSG